MLIDARRLGGSSVVETDVCIVGAGAAGITLALELTKRNLRVALLESGGLEFEEEAQELNAGTCVSAWQIDPMWTRLRQFGGTTAHWGGNCAPLDPWDFEPRAWVPDSGWPFGRSELDAVYPDAFDYCQLPSHQVDPAYWTSINRDFAAKRLTLGGHLQEKIYLKSPPTRFGEVYRQTLADEASPCTVLLHAHATSIDTEDSGTRATHIHLVNPDGVQSRVAARVFVLAGGMENARLLLLSNQALSSGLGNGYDNVGRYFMTHLAVRTGSAQLDMASGAAHYYGLDGWEARFKDAVIPFSVGIQPTQAVQRSRGMLNAVVFFDETYGGERSTGFKALRRIVKRALHGTTPDHLGADLAAVLHDVDQIAEALYGRITGDARYRTLELGYFSEQAPNRNSRLRLGDDLDRFGQRQLVIDWRETELDKHTILETQKLLGEEFGRLGLGRIRIEFERISDPWPHTPDSASHFMGSTRMHEDPRHGVVDANCLVHDMENLFVAGGSVFPTSGSAMVTMNIVALSIRLARHIADKLSRNASNP